MGVLTDEMKRMIREQRLGFVATVCPDGSPNLSPKGALRDLDDDHIVFADIRSPGTAANLAHDPRIEINVVDPLARRGFRFKGTGSVHREGELFERGLQTLRAAGVTSPMRGVVVVHVERARLVVSPAYDSGRAETDIRRRWRAYWEQLWDRQDSEGSTAAVPPAADVGPNDGAGADLR